MLKRNSMQKSLNKSLQTILSIHSDKEARVMNVKSPVPTDLSVHGLEDLHRLKALMETAHLKINKSQIARELGVDRRTVDKYLNGFTKSRKRSSTNCLDPCRDLIRELLSGEQRQLFHYRRSLWQYLCENHHYRGSYPNFCHYLNLIPEFAGYFNKRRSTKPRA